MKKKYSVDVQSIKYKDEEIPIIVKTNGKAYIINENLMVENNHVFNGGGVGTKYTIKINKKETCIYQDKHSFKWHVYKEYENTQGFQMLDEAIMTRDGGDLDYLT